MGEAKRRQTTAAQTVRFQDLESDQWLSARAAGDPETYLKRRAKEEDVVPVPCNGCTECCYHKRVDIDPSQERPETLARLATELGADGVLQLRKRADGACIHLGDAGCTVYEHRPHACRKYDCRLWSLFGVGDTMPGGRHTPIWAFQSRTRYGRVLLTVYEFAGILAAAEFKREGKQWDVGELIERAAGKLPELIKALDAVSKASRETRSGCLESTPD